MTAAASIPSPELPALAKEVERAHLEADRELDAPPRMEAVVWLASHLAAVDQVVYPIVARRLTGGRLFVRQQRRVAHEMQQALRLLEQALAGDAWAGHLDTGALLDRLRGLLTRHAAAEHDMLDRLTGLLTEAEQRELVRRFEAALQHAPTRPHLVVPHAGPLGWLTFRVDALRDRILDAMDSRRIPTPRPPSHQRRPGRWGHYALGQPQFEVLPPEKPE